TEKLALDNGSEHFNKLEQFNRSEHFNRPEHSNCEHPIEFQQNHGHSIEYILVNEYQIWVNIWQKNFQYLLQQNIYK
ncbi:7161_t:CDS:2, partial [Gigaspora margarita]